MRTAGWLMLFSLCWWVLLLVLSQAVQSMCLWLAL